MGTVSRRMIYCIFFASGFAALIYEISWNRQLGLFFGHTAQSAGVILAAYFSGMAVGYYLASKFVRHSEKPLQLYAYVEIFAGVWSLLLPYLAHATVTLFLDQINANQPIARLAIRASIAITLLFPATIALGASFPFIAQFLGNTNPSATRIVTRAYAINTFGAFCGVAIASLFLLRYCGVVGSSYLAASLSICSGIAAWILSRRLEQPGGAIIEQDQRPYKIGYTRYWAVILSGAGILGLEVLYTRLFAVILHNSTYNFATVLAAFLFALALGSWVASWLRSRQDISLWLSRLCLASAATTGGSLLIFYQVTHLRLFSPGGSFAFYLLCCFALALLVILPPMTLAAIILPLTWGELRRESSGSIIGHLTAVNTFAAAGGALLATFVILPSLGLWPAFAFYAILYWSSALIFSWHARGWHHCLLRSPLYICALLLAMYAPPDDRHIRSGYRRIWSQDSAYGPIEVIENSRSHNLLLKQNYYYTLGTSAAATREQRQAHIPLLLHANPTRVAFLGMGTGHTAAGALAHRQIKNIDIIELIPSVVEAARFFHSQGNTIFSDPRVDIITNDARHHLYQKNLEYDVIISDLFVPWHSHTGYLYTIEHYQTARQRLAPGGIFCQWLPLYQIGEREFKLIVDSFANAFPNVSLWHGEQDDEYPLIALIGSKEIWQVESATLARRLQQIGAQRRGTIKLENGQPQLVLEGDSLLSDKDSLYSLYIGEWQLQEGVVLNTDEFPHVEFSTPISQREKVLLRDEIWQEYYRRVLARLSRQDIFK